MKFSIIVPCYNQSEYLDECLQSVINQTYQQWECIIVNDGSKDSTEQIALEWTKKDKRFVYHFKTNGGLSSARNYGITKSEGNFILPLDSDDRISKTYLEEAFNVFRTNANVDLVYGKAEYFGVKTGAWKLPKYNYKELLINNQIYCSCIYKKDFFKNGMYDEVMKKGYEDWEFLVRNLNNNSDVVMLDSVTFYYRIKDQSMWTEMASNKKLVHTIVQYIFEKNFQKYLQNYGVIYSYKTLLKYKFKTKFYTILKATKLIK